MTKRRLGNIGALDRHLAAELRELKGVTLEVKQNLLQSDLICAHQVAIEATKLTGQRDLIKLCPVLLDRDDLLDGLSDVEEIAVLAEVVGVDLGEGNHVVHAEVKHFA